MLAETRHFDNSQHHAASIPNWSQVYDQISPGNFESSLTRLNTGTLEIFREVSNQRVVQYGKSPASHIHFAIPLSLPLQPSLQGCPVTPDCIMALQGGEDFVFHVPPHFDAIQLSVPYHDLQALAPRLWQQLQQRHSQPLLQAHPQRLQAARELLQQVLEQAVGHPELLAYSGSQKLLQHQCISLLLDMLNESSLPARHNLTYATHCDIVKRSQRIVQASPDEPVTVLDLCQQLRLSRRTLQNSFQLVTGTTPVDYLRAIRLNAVRRMLQAAQGPTHTISDAAGHWGFYHLGHFSHDYRRLFAELPSETLARARRS